MIKGHIKYYFLLIASIIGLCCLAISYAETDANASSASSTSATQASDAYNKLTEAQATATAADETAEKTNKDKPGDFLSRIADNTYALLKAFNYYSLNWLQIYSTPTSNTLDTLFGSYVTTSQKTFKNQLTLLTGGNLIIENKGKDTEMPVSSIYSLDKKEINIYPSQIPPPEKNYATLVKQNAKDSPVPDNIKLSAQYFVKNASGINIYHVLPSSIQAGTDPIALRKYITFSNTLGSIASYNAYILNNHLADLQNNFKLTQAQMDLQDRASDNEWLTHVNKEESIGVILRQLLLFNSQLYVLMADSLATQKQLLAATAMTNALIIAGNGQYEKMLLDDAKK